MSLCNGEPGRCEAAHGGGEHGGAASERVHCAEPRQHGMSLCNGEPVRCEAAHGIGESGGAAVERAQSAEPRQHGMGLCNNEPVGCEARHAVCESGGAGVERLLCTRSRQLGMGNCNVDSVGREAVHGIGESSKMTGERVHIDEVPYIDDVLFMVVSKDHFDHLFRTTRLGEIVHETAKEFLLTLSYEVGKTEVSMDLRGSNVKSAQHLHYVQNCSKLVFEYHRRSHRG